MNVWERDRHDISDDFKSSFMLAIALHLFLIMIAFIAGRIIYKTIKPDAALEIMRASVRVDVVGMPKLTLQELKEMEMPTEAPTEPNPVEATKTEITEAPAKPDDVVMPDEKKTTKSFSNFLQEYSTKKVKTSTKVKQGDRSGKPTGLDSLIIEGNRLSKGSSLTGDTSDVATSALVGFGEIIRDRVREHWRLPGFLRDQQLKCRIHIWIGLRGEILKTEIRESSGNSEFDTKAEAAVRAAAPFGVPPVDAAPQLSARGIILAFPL